VSQTASCTDDQEPSSAHLPRLTMSFAHRRTDIGDHLKSHISSVQSAYTGHQHDYVYIIVVQHLIFSNAVISSLLNNRQIKFS